MEKETEDMLTLLATHVVVGAYVSAPIEEKRGHFGAPTECCPMEGRPPSLQPHNHRAEWAGGTA